MGVIKINGINCYAYHGCLPEEAKIGGQYIVNVILEGDFSPAELSDNLNDTADYVLVYEIVKEEMAVRSKLIEHVAKRIKNRLSKTFYGVNSTVEVIKLKPPINGDVDSVSYIV